MAYLKTTEIERRARAGLAQDGIPEIILGVALLVGAGYLALQFFDEVRLYGMPWMMVLAASLIMARVRRKVTYPRIGYVKFRPSPLKLVVVGLLALVLLGGIAGFLIFRRTGSRLPSGFWQGLVFGIGLVGAGMGAWAGWRLGIRRYYLYAALGLLGVVVPWALGLGVQVRALVMMGAPALAMIPGGVIALVRFLREHPKQSVEATDAA